MRISEKSDGVGGRREFLASLAEVSGNLNNLDGAFLVTIDEEGACKVVSFGLSPLDMVTVTSNISKEVTSQLFTEKVASDPQFREFLEDLESYLEEE